VSRQASRVLRAPLSGWSTPLDELPDEVFARRMLGDGVAIDPTEGTLHAPCDGEVAVLAAAHHAVTLRGSGGIEVLMHVGLDTVVLGGEGFRPLVRAGQQVHAGDVLLEFDLDFLAARAKSLLTPVIVGADSGFRVLNAQLGRVVACGEMLLEVAPVASAAAPLQPPSAVARGELASTLRVELAHGIHARPAALIAAALRGHDAQVRVRLRERETNARSTVGLMGLNVQRGDEIEVRASGPDAAAGLGALAAALKAAAAREAAEPSPPSRVPQAERAAAGPGALGGVIASRGLALGVAFPLHRAEPLIAETGGGVDAETRALDQARARVQAQLLRRAADPSLPGAAREIAAAHAELLEDPELLEAARALIALGKSAGFAWRASVRTQAQALGSLSDPRLRERVADLMDLESQVLAELAGPGGGPAPQIVPQAVVIARDLTPSQLLGLDGTRLAGLALAEGGATSHVAILAAALGVPALVALGEEVLAVGEGTTLVLDAETARLEIDPPPARVTALREALTQRRAREAATRQAAQREGHTADGVRIEVLANLASRAEADAAVRNGAEGCGLLRTEFLFLDRESAPDATEQAHAYQEIADALGARPLTIRTLDAGGDKPIAYLPLPEEENPALGLRGVRTSLACPQLLREQLTAVLAVRSAAEVRLLLPMVTDLSELEQVRALLAELPAARARPVPLKVGVMIETPASALLAEALAAAADFLSIGTNDLTQYSLAMDRGHPRLAQRLDALHPAVLALIARTAQAAARHGRHAAVCGGLASEPLAAALLVGLGVHELSAVPAVIPELKARLARVTSGQCRALAARALACVSAAEVRALLTAQEGA